MYACEGGALDVAQWLLESELAEVDEKSRVRDHWHLPFASRELTCSI